MHYQFRLKKEDIHVIDDASDWKKSVILYSGYLCDKITSTSIVYFADFQGPPKFMKEGKRGVLTN